jgi:tetratricopeptide (TPR) repeat protein
MHHPASDQFPRDKIVEAIAYAQQGDIRLLMLDYPGALDKYKKALKINPFDGEIWSAEGKAHYQYAEFLRMRFKGSNIVVDENHYEMALNCFNKAIELDPGNEAARKNRDLLLNIKGT